MFTVRALFHHLFAQTPTLFVSRGVGQRFDSEAKATRLMRCGVFSVPGRFCVVYHAERFPRTLQAMRARKLSFGKTGEIAAAFSAVHSLANKLRIVGAKSFKTRTQIVGGRLVLAFNSILSPQAPRSFFSGLLFLASESSQSTDEPNGVAQRSLIFFFNLRAKLTPNTKSHRNPCQSECNQSTTFEDPRVLTACHDLRLLTTAGKKRNQHLIEINRVSVITSDPMY